METGVTDLGSLDGTFDLQSTLESGRSYLWDRPDGQMYECGATYGGNVWYQAVVPLLDGVSGKFAVVRVRQTNDVSEWESDVDAVPLLTYLLRPDDDPDAVVSEMPDEPLVRRIYEAYPGIWLVRDPPFGRLASFICSTQMHVSHIFGAQPRLRETYSERVEFGGETYFVYLTPEQLTEATEGELRSPSLGYHVPHIRRMAEMIAMGEATPVKARGRDYEDIHEFLTAFIGIDDKVADCVLLFSLSCLEVVPFDTQVRSAIEEHYPDCDRGNYAGTS